MEWTPGRILNTFISELREASHSPYNDASECAGGSLSAQAGTKAVQKI